MDQLEIFRLSAEAMGWRVEPLEDGRYRVYDSQEPTDIPIFGIGNWIMNKWNPFTNAEQRWQCVETLLKTHVIEMEQLRDGAAHYVLNKNGRKSDGCFFLDCPASEFPARALAELHRRNKEE